MFTHASDIRRELSVIGYKPEEISFVQRGVMTDKFIFFQGGQRYIARCYPPGREWLAEKICTTRAIFREGCTLSQQVAYVSIREQRKTAAGV